jgi:hypothetical protein
MAEGNTPPLMSMATSNGDEVDGQVERNFATTAWVPSRFAPWAVREAYGFCFLDVLTLRVCLV